MGVGRCAAVVVVAVGVAVHGGGVGVVECAEAADGAAAGWDFFEQGVEKIGGVEQVGESVLQGVGGSGEIKGGGNGGGGAWQGGVAIFAEIFGEYVAAE